MKVLSRIIGAGGKHRSTLAEVEDGLFIGAGGVVGDSTPAVICAPRSFCW